MLKKVVYVAVLVSDQDRALDFYTNVIGLEKRGDYPTPAGPRFLTVAVKGQDFELVLWPGTPARGEAGSAVYTIEVEDIRTAFETLKSRGVRFARSASRNHSVSGWRVSSSTACLSVKTSPYSVSNI
jgi:catechol 2,3-dioxygenase-like lactoylglutathione lyase family enzyme